MKTKTNLFRNISAFAALALFGFGSAAKAQYTLTPLPAYFEPLTLNNDGQILGFTNSSLYLVTNGVSQFVSKLATTNFGAIYQPFLNQKGQIAGIDSDGNLFLCFNGVKQIISGPKYAISLVGLTDNGEIVWNEKDSATASNQVYAYQNGVTQNLGVHQAGGVNNAGQITGNGEIYSNGVWQSPPHYISGWLNNNGQILYYKTQQYQDSQGYYYGVATIGIYTISMDSSIDLASYSFSQYISAPNITGFNNEGDFIGIYYGPGASSSNQSAGFGYIRGQSVGFGGINPYPSFPNVDYDGVTALNNRGDVIAYFHHSYYEDGYVFYNADTTSEESISQLLTGSDAGYYDASFLNDRRQLIVGSDKNYFASPNALTPADSVSGVVMLEGEVVNAPAQNVTFEFRDAASGQTLFTKSAVVSPYGGFTVSGVPSGSYNVRVKSPKNLAQIVNVVKASGALSGVSVFLPAGDANNDNGVDATDFGLFISAYGSDSSDPGSGYDPTCDFNGDGFVDSFDFGLFVGNYNTQGAL